MDLPPKTSSKKINRRKQRSKLGHQSDVVDNVNVISENISDLSLDNNISNNSKIKQLKKNQNKENKVIKKQLLEYEYNFKIFPSKEYLCHFYKHRNKNIKYVSLKSYTVFRTLKKIHLHLKHKESNTKKCIKNDEVIKINNDLITKKHQHKRKKRLDKQIVVVTFPIYLTDTEVKEGLKTRQLLKGSIRINPKNSDFSFVSNEDSTQLDYFIKSVLDRNRALEGDEVVLKVKPEKDWIGRQKTAEIVYILKEVHPRICVGILKPLEHNSEYAVLVPRDQRLPNIHISSLSWPKGFAQKPQLYQNILFLAKILEWNVTSHATGVILEQIGLCGDLKVETLSILKEFCLDTSPFKMEEIKDYIPKSKEIPSKEFQYREDIRHECIFTIDPLMARDLDDAVSVKTLPNGHYEVGVHISDASYYLPEGSPLDEIVSKKATTIYLVDNVYHMLPVNLCLHCSLLPGEDKLAFSIFWEMDDHGQIFSTRFARTILNSCAQLAYEHAQQMIDNPDKVLSTKKLPKIYNGFTSKDLSGTIGILRKIASHLRDARMRNGSLRIDQIKLLFSINPCTGEPIDFMVYENKEAHRLIEEFMLLANISVAKKIYDTFPEIAFLRCHNPPKYTMLLDAQRALETCGIHIDISSSGAISSSLRKYITPDFQGLCRGIVLNNIFAKPMIRANYFCSSIQENECDFNHYALSVPIYTHFTSPIRRYADIMVHRLLAASLGYADKPDWSVDHVQAIANNCNIQKYNAKRAGEVSSDLYLAFYIGKHQPYIQECVVTDVRDRSFDVIVINTGSCVRVHQNKCEDSPEWKLEVIPCAALVNGQHINKEDKKIFRLILHYPKTKKYPQPQITVIEMFSIVKVKLTKIPKKYKLDAYLLRPTGQY